FALHIEKETPCHRAGRCANNGVGPFVKRPAEIIPESLAKVVAITQWRSGNLAVARVHRFNLRGVVVFAILQKLVLQRSYGLYDVEVGRQILGGILRFLRLTFALGPGPWFQAGELGLDEPEGSQA